MKVVKDGGVYTIYATSSETKPRRDNILALYDGVPVIWYEMDTQKAFMYDYAGNRWLEQ